MTQRQSFITRFITRDRPLLWAIVWTLGAVFFVFSVVWDTASHRLIASLPLWIAAALAWYRVVCATYFRGETHDTASN